MTEFLKDNRDLISKYHFGLILFVIGNFLFGQLLNYSFSSNIILGSKILIYSSGILLFLLSLKPLKKSSLYFSLYLLLPLGVIISWLADGILGAVVGSLFFWTISTDSKVLEFENYKICSEFHGFLGRGGDFKIVKNYFYLFDHSIGYFRIGESNSFFKGEFSINEQLQQIHLKFDDNFYSTETNKINRIDTTLIYLENKENN